MGRSQRLGLVVVDGTWRTRLTQCLALARAAAIEADLLVLDDVSFALDATTEADLWNALTRMGVTIITATSRPATLWRADQVLVVDPGRLTDVGTGAVGGILQAD